MSKPIKNVAKLMEATTKICSEIILYTNEVFANFVKYNISNPQKSAALLEATTMLASLWTSLNTIGFATANVMNARKSIMLLEIAGKSDPEYVDKKKQMIESEFFKFQSAVKVIIEALQFFSKFQTERNYTDVINLIIGINTKIEKTSVPELRAEVGKKMKSVKIGKAEHVYEDAINIREKLRSAALVDLPKSHANIENYIRTRYCCKNVEEFLELSRSSDKDKFRKIALSAGIHMDRITPPNLLNEIKEYIKHHIVQYNVSKSFTCEPPTIDQLDGEITMIIEGVECVGAVSCMKTMINIIRDVDIIILKNYSGETDQSITSPDNKRKEVISTIRANLQNIEKDPDYFIIGGDDDDNEKIYTAIKLMDDFEKSNADRIKNLEQKFAEKAVIFDQTINLWKLLIGPDTSTCIRKVYPYLGNYKPEELL